MAITINSYHQLLPTDPAATHDPTPESGPITEPWTNTHVFETSSWKAAASSARSRALVRLVYIQLMNGRRTGRNSIQSLNSVDRMWEFRGRELELWALDGALLRRW